MEKTRVRKLMLRRTLLPIILVVSLYLRLIGINHGLPDINRFFWETDEATTVNIAMGMGSGDMNPHSFNKPSLVYYVTFFLYGIFYAAGRVLGYFSSPVNFAVYYLYDTYWFYIIARCVSLLFGVASVYMAFLCGKKAFGEKAGLWAAVFLAMAPLHIVYSRMALSDTPAVFFMLLVAYHGLKISENNKTADYVLAGLFSGLAASTKYHAGFIWLIVPFLVLYRLAFRESVNYRGFLYSAILLILGFFIGTPYAAIDIFTFTNSLKVLFLAKSNMPNLTNWWVEHIRQFWLNVNLGPTLVVFSFVGVGYALVKHSKSDLILLLIISVYYVFFSQPKISWSPVHYLLPIVPFLCILIGRFISSLLRKKTYYILLAIAILPVLFSNIKEGITLSHFDTKYYARKWIEKNIPAGSNILVTGLYDPQLTLTRESLERLKPRNFKNILLPSRGDVLVMNKNIRNSLKNEKVISMTAKGPAYNVYLISDSSVLNSLELSLKNYINVLKIEYLIISDAGWKALAETSLYHKYREVFKSLGDSFSIYANKLQEFSPKDWQRPGTKITIFKIRKDL